MRRKYEKKLQGKVFESIDDLPIYNWWKIHETSDYSYLLRAREAVGGPVQKILSKRWEVIYDGYIERFGFAPELLDLHRKRVKLAKLKVQRMVSGDRKLNTPIKIAEVELSETIKAGTNRGKVDFFEVKAVIEERRGMPLDHHRVTVSEFFTYLSLLNKTTSPSGRKR